MYPQPQSINQHYPPPTSSSILPSIPSTTSFTNTNGGSTILHHQYVNNSNNNGLINSSSQSNQYGYQQQQNDDLNKKALTLLFNRTPSKPATTYYDSKCYATSGVSTALHYHDSSNHHSKNMFSQQQYYPNYLVQNISTTTQQPVNNTTNMYNQFNQIYPTTTSAHAPVNPVSAHTIPSPLLSKTQTTTFHNNIVESGVISNTTNVTSVKTVSTPEQSTIDQKVISSTTNNLQSFNEIIGMIDEKKKRKDSSDQQQNKKRKKEPVQVKEEDEEEECEEEVVEEDFVNGSSTEKLLPIRALAHLVGLSKDEGKTWRYRDVRRALFEKTSKEHSNFIEKNQQHSILRQRLPHKLTLVSFCKRIMLLVFHFIIRDGREPKFFLRTHVKKDLIENTLENEAPEFYKKINCNIAMKIHAFICTGLSIEQAAKNVLQNIPQGDKSAVATVNVTQCSSSTNSSEQHSSNSIEPKTSPILDSPTLSPINPTLPSLRDLLKQPSALSAHVNCQSCPHCKQEI
ncbi:predicted protein [Naegleria gruberi]|uniref:Predicted protein n=1 Tax=Naegleria gruberi TaxID=5762 RepID=D2VEP6_NAEGR|nr:uncharacterized protein NAEGRDRAFT_57983 [Naegleria gruberi]EFC44543.1 predicted protein [Naegleria gruberi]|eukprot:XP_002677287.1 predicted protein [Naegleria gruberi strain NEG-M]